MSDSGDSVVKEPTVANGYVVDGDFSRQSVPMFDENDSSSVEVGKFYSPAAMFSRSSQATAKQEARMLQLSNLSAQTVAPDHFETTNV
jgi:hypothetical protein